MRMIGHGVKQCATDAVQVIRSYEQRLRSELHKIIIPVLDDLIVGFLVPSLSPNQKKYVRDNENMQKECKQVHPFVDICAEQDEDIKEFSPEEESLGDLRYTLTNAEVEEILAELT